MIPHLLQSPGLTPLLTALGWTVMHFIWQGAVIGLLAALVLAVMRDRPPGIRYGVAVGALFACALAFITTAVVLLPSAAAAPAAAPDLEVLASAIQTRSASGSLIEIVGWLWLAGVALLSVRLLLQSLAAQRLKRTQVFPPTPYWQGVFTSLREELAVSPSVCLLRSALAEVPMVVGFFAPVVLVPASAFTSLSPDQLRSILAHELSHIRRWDHLTNFAQAIIEVVLYYHPAVWWLSRQARIERENCCDDAAVRSIGSARIVAEALARLESIRAIQPRAALAANGGPLMNRITRLLAPTTSRASTSPRWPGVAAISVAALLTIGAVTHTTSLANLHAQPPTEAEIDSYLETVIAKLQEGIEGGEITADQARAKLQAVQKHVGMRHPASPANVAHIGAATSGDVLPALTPAEDEAWRRDLEVVMKDLHRAIDAGEMTPEQAEQRLTAVFAAREKRLAELQVEGEASCAGREGHDVARHVDGLESAASALESAELADVTERMHTIKAQAAEIQEAARAGDIAPEQAELQLAELHEALLHHAAQLSSESVARAIEESVRSGAMTAEHAAVAARQVERIRALGESQRARAADEAARNGAADEAAQKSAADEALVRQKMAEDIRRAVEMGAMSRQQANDTLAALERVQVQRLNARDAAAAADLNARALHEALRSARMESEPRAELRSATLSRAAARLSDDQVRQLHESMLVLLDQLRDQVSSGAITVDQAQAVLDTIKQELKSSSEKRSPAR